MILDEGPVSRPLFCLSSHHAEAGAGKNRHLFFAWRQTMANKLKELQNRHAALVKALRQTSDAIPGPPPDTANDDERQAIEAKQKEMRAKYDALKEELGEVKVGLAREEELQDIERGLIPTDPTLDSSSANHVEVNTSPVEPKKWDGLGQYLQAVAFAATNPANLWDERLRQSAVSGLNEGVASQGGFLVQTDFVSELLRRTYESNQVLNGGPGYSGVRRIPISANSNSVKINAVNETSRADGSRWGGVQAYWIEEAGTKSDSKPDFRQIELSLKKLVGLCYATDELLQDASALEAVIMEHSQRSSPSRSKTH